MEVEPRKYRFRMLNASNSRFYHLTLVPADDRGTVLGKPSEAPPFFQVGTDSGLLPTPLRLHYLVISPVNDSILLSILANIEALTWLS